MKKGHFVIALLLSISALNATVEPVPAVQWGEASDIVTANQNFTKPSINFITGSYYSDPPSPDYYPDATNSPSTVTPSFYAAAAMDLGAGATNNVINSGYVIDGNANDYLRFATLKQTELSEMRSMTMWKSADFLVTGTLTKLAHTGSATITAGSNTAEEFRFIIRTANLNYYASADLGFGSTLEITDETSWYAFNPLSGGAASVGSSVGALDLTQENIIAVGFYARTTATASTSMQHFTYGFLAEVEEELDLTPPTPNPAAFTVGPVAISSTQVRMTAAVSEDLSGVVEYLFTETTGNPGGTSSNWQTSSSYTDDGLIPGTTYSYTVTTRDAFENAGTASAPRTVVPAAAFARPNVIMLFIDDLGYGDIEPFGCDDIPTPNMNRLADEGIILTQTYVTNPPCCPSRASLMMGMYGQRFGKYGMMRDQPLPEDKPTFAEIFRDYGYVTGQVGKWDVGGGNRSPQAGRGFMEIAAGSGKDYLRVGAGENGEDIWLTEINGDQLLEFVERHRLNEQPFMMYWSPLAVHSPHDNIPQEYTDRVLNVAEERRELAGGIVSVDDQVGRLLDYLDTHNMRENTLIIFASDNGPNIGEGGSSTPYLGGKGSSNRNKVGWTLTPAIVSWPGIIPQGTSFDGMLCTIDFFSTMLAAANLPIPDHADGINLLPYLTGEKTGDVHEYIYWYNKGDDRATRNLQSVRWGKWRTYRTFEEDPWQLYDLENDPTEANNLAGQAQYSDLLSQLEQKHLDWQTGLEPIWEGPAASARGWNQDSASEDGWIVTDGNVFELEGLSPSRFAYWIVDHPGVGLKSGFNDDPDGDGKANGLEHFLGTAPDSVSPGVWASMSGDTFTVKHPINTNLGNEIAYTYRWSTDLVNFYDAGSSNSEGTTTVHCAQSQSDGQVTVTPTATGTEIPDRIFITIEVSEN
ncbi:MAG: sulfatase-like hydrolase/transferase [Coraliomargarita sp.]